MLRPTSQGDTAQIGDGLLSPRLEQCPRISKAGKKCEPMNIAIFDFEGTLVDFQWQLKAAMEEVYPLIEECISSCNLDREIIKQADYCRLYNYLQKNIADLDLRKETINRIETVFDFFDADAALRWNLYPEVHNLLSSLKQAGWGMALDSNVGRKALNEMFEKYSLNHYFDFTISRNEVSLLKPESEGINHILAYYQSNAAPDQTFMIGDSVTDIETARKAEIKVAILTNGEDRTERLRSHQPDYLINNLAELEKIL
ncbi:MAG: HAD family hydrolase [Pseudomonadota bacterium]|nr:HAD family hydrolase [Pseudomonadota bacterium]